MPLTDVGLNLLADAIIGGSGFSKFNNTNARIGVGDGNTAFNAAQTDLQGASKARQGMEATYPQRTNNDLTFRAVFGTGAANFDWGEWGLFNAASSGQMLSRKVEDLGTKTGAVSRQITVTVTIDHS